MSQLLDNPHVSTTDRNIGTDDVYQVVLYNDSHNSFEHVVKSLMSVFGHNGAIAQKVTMEAHTKGRAVAEVEEFEKAAGHKIMLGACGLKSDVEKI